MAFKPNQKARIKHNDGNCFEVGEIVEIVQEDMTHKNSPFKWYQVRGENPNGRGTIMNNVPENFLEELE